MPVPKKPMIMVAGAMADAAPQNGKIRIIE
jgi:hypothetical protein